MTQKLFIASLQILIIPLMLAGLGLLFLPRAPIERPASPHVAAAQNLLLYKHARMKFSSSHGGYYGGPAELERAGLITPTLAEQLGAQGPSVSNNGYEGSASGSGDAPNGLGRRYAAELHPSHPGSSGTLYFGLDERGIIWQSATSPFSQANGHLTMPSDAKPVQ